MGDVVAAAAAATGWWAGLGCGGGGSVVLEVTLDRPAAKKIKVRAARGLLLVGWMMRLTVRSGEVCEGGVERQGGVDGKDGGGGLWPQSGGGRGESTRTIKDRQTYCCMLLLLLLALVSRQRQRQLLGSREPKAGDDSSDLPLVCSHIKTTDLLAWIDCNDKSILLCFRNSRPQSEICTCSRPATKS